MFEDRSFLFTFDIRSAYQSININQGSRTWLGFALQIDGKVRYYVFNSLPFGLSTCGAHFLEGFKSSSEVLENKGP